MKTNNFAWQRRAHFIRIVIILITEVVGFIFWALDRLTTPGIDPRYQWNVVIGLFIGALILNWIWLWLEDIFFFNKNDILRRLYAKKIQLKERKAYLEKTLAGISNDQGQAIHTSASIEVWDTIPEYTSKSFQKIISDLRKELNRKDDDLLFVEGKIDFFLKTQRGSLKLYCKSKL